MEVASSTPCWSRAQLLLCSLPALITRNLILLASARVHILTLARALARALALALALAPALALTPLTLNALAFGPALRSLVRKFLFSIWVDGVTLLPPRQVLRPHRGSICLQRFHSASG